MDCEPKNDGWLWKYLLMTIEIMNQFTYQNLQRLDVHRAISPALSVLFQ